MSEGQGGQGAAGGGTPDFQASLGEYKGNPAVATFKDAPSLAKSYIELSGKLGQSPIDRLEPPKDEAGWNKVWEKLGRPKDHTGYGLKNENYAKAAHKMGLTKAQAEGFLQEMVSQGTTVTQQRDEARKAELTKAEQTKVDTFKREWGDKYDLEVGLTAKAWQNEKFLPKELRERLESLGLHHDPHFVRLFNRLGHASQEGGMFSGMGGGGSDQSMEGLRAARGKLEAQMTDMQTKKGFDATSLSWRTLLQERQDLLTKEGKAKFAAVSGT